MTDTLILPYFDGASVSLFEPVEDAIHQSALDRFLTLGPADRIADSQHVYAYYKDFHAIANGEDWLDAEMGVPATPQDIWPHIDVYNLEVRTNPDDELAYVMISGNCAWDPEHGLLMVWCEGAFLNKVGGYDDHTTNEFAYGDAALAHVVFKANNAEHTTYLAAT